MPLPADVQKGWQPVTLRMLILFFPWNIGSTNNWCTVTPKKRDIFYCCVASLLFRNACSLTYPIRMVLVRRSSGGCIGLLIRPCSGSGNGVDMAASRIKKALALLLQASGWFSLRSRSVLNNSAFILMYHRVLPKEDARGGRIPVQPGMYVTPESFRVHLSWLSNQYSILSLTELAGRLASGQDISRCVVLTFDDGWADNYRYAYPLLKEYNSPATIFLASGFIGTVRRFWPEEIGWAAFAVSAGRFDVSLFPGPLADMMQTEMTSRSKPLEVVDRMIAEIKTWDEDRRTTVAESCAAIRETKDGCGESLLMSWDEAREMSASGLVDFGSHTVSHALLDQLPGERVRRELEESAERICGEIGSPVELFAYPNGNYDSTVLSMLPGIGIKVAVTTRHGFVRPDSSLLELPRIAIHEDVGHTPALFKWRLFVR